jgi:spermidine/putrescine transport system ATP-binding protein
MQIELKEIQHRVGTTFVYVTHDQTEALTMSDRIAVMRDGRVEQLGTGRDVYERPRTRFVATFLGDSNLLEGQLEARDERETVLRTAGLRLVAPGGDPAPAGAAASLCVRPERVRLFGADDPPPPEYANRLEAQVTDVTFKGAFIEYRLAARLGAALTAQAHADGSRSIERGAAVVAAWRRDDGVVLLE